MVEGGSSLACNLHGETVQDEMAWKRERELSGILTLRQGGIEVERESVWGMCLKFNDIWK